MKDNNFFKFIIPAVAVLVIFESVVLVDSLTNSNKLNILVKNKANSLPVKIVNEKKVAEPSVPSIDLAFGLNNKDLKVGQVYPVEINLAGKTDLSLDAINLYVKTDLEAFDVTNLQFSPVLSKPTYSKVSDKKNVVVVNYLISDPKGFKLKQNETLKVLKFDIKPKKMGSFDFEISTGNQNQESVTMFVENGSSKVLPFSSTKLNVNVLR